MPGDRDRDRDRDRFPMDELNGKSPRNPPHNTGLQLHRPKLTVSQKLILDSRPELTESQRYTT